MEKEKQYRIEMNDGSFYEGQYELSTGDGVSHCFFIDNDHKYLDIKDIKEIKEINRFQEILDGCPNAVTFDSNDEVFIIRWSEKGLGLGEYTFYKENGKLCCRSELHSKDMVKRMLCKFVDACEFTELG